MAITTSSSISVKPRKGAFKAFGNSDLNFIVILSKTLCKPAEFPLFSRLFDARAGSLLQHIQHIQHIQGVQCRRVKPPPPRS